LLIKPKILSTKTINPKIDKNRFDYFEHDFIQTKSLDFEFDYDYDFNIFSSQNAVESILKSKHLEKIKSKPCLCVGQKTKQLLQKHQFEVLEATNYAEHLTEIINQKYKTNSFAFFCGNLSLPTIPDYFTKKDIIFAKVLVYETIKTPKNFNQAFEALLFFSPSAVESFLEQNEITNELCFCIGHTTANALKNIDNKQIILAKMQSIDGVLEALNDYYS
jgi:uroporphyrinogen-III synthase